MRALVLAVLALGAGACVQTEHETVAQHGEDLSQSAAIADSRYNAFACTTCHAPHPGDGGDRIFPGAVLEGASDRPSWWGGNVLDLSTAVSDCFQHFMQGEQLDPTSDTAQALDAYLMELAQNAPASTTAAVAFTIPPSIHDIMPADATSGADLYRRACFTCHGAIHTGVGRLGTLPSIVPDDTFTAHANEFTPVCLRDVFVEKIRHGSYLGYAGSMPPFSVEVLSDAQIADILAYIGAPTDVGTCP